jgi:hypothetical protein
VGAEVCFIRDTNLTYVIIATSFFTYNEDTATVVIAVGISDINLALGKPATQSSTYLYHSGLVCLMRLIE